MGIWKLEQFKQEVIASYRGESYLIRDNGAVCRQRRRDKRKRPLDEKWTFGVVSMHDGYRRVCGVPVHRIIATAFHGEAPTRDHIVDHLDTNRANNRAENLRWVTRLENLQNNPTTLRYIEKKWGSVEEMVNDQRSAEKAAPISGRDWMQQVLIEETLYGERAIDSLSALAVQRHWKTPSEFPACPEVTGQAPLNEYLPHLEYGAVFSRNQYGESIVEDAEFDRRGEFIGVLCKTASSVKGWAVAKVTFEDGRFVHISEGTYFTLLGAGKAYCQLIGVPWDESEDSEG